MLHKKRCCCNCKSHLEDFHHCTTTDKKTPPCVCSDHKGWVCIADGTLAYSGWSEHGLCELHTLRNKQ